MKSLALIALLFAFFTCENTLAAEENLSAPDKDVIAVTGTIRHFFYGGGFYGIVGDDGREYKPLGLTSSFEVEGLKVILRGRVITKKLLFTAKYIPIEIIDIRRASRDEVAGKRVYSDSSKPIEIKPGKVFIISLESPETKEFVWKLAGKLDKNVLIKKNVYYLNTKDRGLVIGSGKSEERWIFTAVGPGEATLTFKYVRPWEKESAPPTKETSFKVIVR